MLRPCKLYSIFFLLTKFEISSTNNGTAENIPQGVSSHITHMQALLLIHYTNFSITDEYDYYDKWRVPLPTAGLNDIELMLKSTGKFIYM